MIKKGIIYRYKSRQGDSYSYLIDLRKINVVKLKNQGIITDKGIKKQKSKVKELDKYDKEEIRRSQEIKYADEWDEYIKNKK